MARGGRSRRWVWVAVPVAFVLTLALVGFGLYSLWVPHYRPAVHDDEVYGIDVSNHQGEIDWSSVADSDLDFAHVGADGP